MQVSADIHYPDTTPEQAFALIVDLEFRKEVCRATHAQRFDVDIDNRGDGTATITVRRTIPSEVPGFVKHYVGETVDIVQREQWSAANPQGERTAEMTLQVIGQPATMIATASTRAAANGSLTSIRGNLKVSIPFVGKKLEPVIAEAILGAVAAEQRIVDKWLGASP